MIAVSNTERIHATDGLFQTECRSEFNGGYEWRPISYHGTLEAALAESADREIRTIPNDDLHRWAEAAEKVVATYKQIFARTLESRPSSIGRRQSG